MEAENIIRSALRGKRHPMVMCSFGKDSLVVLDMLVRTGVRPRVLVMQDLDEPFDTDFAASFGLDITILPRGRAFLVFSHGQPQLFSLVSIGESFIGAPFRMVPYPGEGEFHCIDEMLRAEYGEVAWQLRPDILFWGNKAQDLLRKEGQDCLALYREFGEMQGHFYDTKVPKSHLWKLGNLECCSPIIDWSSEDVWGYLEERNIPVSPKMYDGKERRRFETPCCYRCHDPSEAATVSCPKLRREIMNLGALTQEDGLSKLRGLRAIDDQELEALRA